MTPAVEIIRLNKQFAARRSIRETLRRPRFFNPNVLQVLKDINLRVEPGEMFCLLGPNGAGKTTLMKILSTLVLPTSGQVRVQGLDVVRNAEQVKQRLGMVVGDERSFYWRLTGRQNLRFFSILSDLPKKLFESRIEEILTLLQLHPFADKMFKDYSTGTRQKFAIARGLLTQPDILLMDEPTRSLDVQTRRNLKQFIREVLVKQHGKTIILTTHELEDLEDLADRMAIMNHGEIKACGTVPEIRALLTLPGKSYRLTLANPRADLVEITAELPFNGYVRVNQEMVPAAELSTATPDMTASAARKEIAALSQTSGCSITVNILKDEIAIHQVLASLIQNGAQITDCQIIKPKLEAIYEQVIS